MADLTQEQYEQLPEFARGDYTEVDGVYKHAGMLKVKQTANALDAELKQVKSSNAELSERMTTFEQEQAKKIEQATAEALANAETSKDVEEIKRIHNEKMKDLEARTKEQTRAEVLAEISQNQAIEKANTTASRLAKELAKDEDAQESLLTLFEKVIKPGENGEVTFFNSDGTASSLDENGFKAEALKDKRYKWLVKAEPPTKGGGMANGSGFESGRTANETNKKAEEAKKKGDLNGFLAAAININQ